MFPKCQLDDDITPLQHAAPRVPVFATSAIGSCHASRGSEEAFNLARACVLSLTRAVAISIVKTPAVSSTKYYGEYTPVGPFTTADLSYSLGHRPFTFTTNVATRLLPLRSSKLLPRRHLLRRWQSAANINMVQNRLKYRKNRPEPSRLGRSRDTRRRTTAVVRRLSSAAALHAFGIAVAAPQGSIVGRLLRMFHAGGPDSSRPPAVLGVRSLSISQRIVGWIPDGFHLWMIQSTPHF